MNTRERWLTTGLILVSLVLIIGGLWQAAQFGDAHEAVRQFITVEQQAERDEENTALMRQARPELRRMLSAGEFGPALKRMAALREEDRAVSDPERRGKSIAIDALWPPNSPQREQARKVLLAVVEKQQQGYDTRGAQDALARVADAARSGKQPEALAAFHEVESLIQAAPLRPGFKAPEAPAAPGTAPIPGAPGAPALAAGLPQVTEQQIQQVQQFTQMLLPQMMEQANPEQRGLLQRLQVFGNDLIAAHRARKDVRAVLVPLSKVFPALKANDIKAADQALGKARKALAAAPQLPPGPAPGTPAPSPVDQQIQQTLQFIGTLIPQLMASAKPEQRPLVQRLQVITADMTNAYVRGHKDIRPVFAPLKRWGDAYKAGDLKTAEQSMAQARAALAAAPALPKAPPAPAGTAPAAPAAPPQVAHAVPPPVLPPVGGGPNAAALTSGPAAERILQALDALRRLPDSVYQQQRAQLPMLLVAAASGQGNIAGLLKTAAGRPNPAVGKADGLRLELTPLGDIAAFHARTADLAAGTPGGLFWETSGKPVAPLRGPTSQEGAGALQRVTVPDGAITVSYKPDGDDLSLEVTARRDREGVPGTLLLRVPLRAAGWRWNVGERSEVVAMDGAYTLTPEGSAPLAAILFKGPGTDLRITAATAASVSYDPQGAALLLRFPVPAAKGNVHHTVRLALDPPAKPMPK